MPVPGLWETAASPGLFQICLAPGLFPCVAVTRAREGARPSWTFPGPKAIPESVSLCR